MGSAFTASRDQILPVLQELKKRNLLFLDSRTSAKSVAYETAREIGLTSTVRDVFLDDNQSAENVAAMLEKTEQVALKHGDAVAIGHPHAITLAVLKEWIPKAKARGIQLVPLSTVIHKREREGR